MKRAFNCAISGTISAVKWVIDTTMSEDLGQEVLLHYKLQSNSINLAHTDIDVPSLIRVSQTVNQFRGNVKIKLIGTYAGKVVHVFLNGEVFASGAAMIWQQMISEPEAYINGVKKPNDSWTFDLVE